MEELQGWWEVPTIAHFCHVFQAAFNLFHFEIEELESALLQNDNNPYCASVEQLAMRLVKGSYCRMPVTPENWEELLHNLLDEKVPHMKGIEHLGNFSEPFNILPVRKKVQILLKLCELRLDLEQAAEAIKNLRSRDLRIEPIGTDNYKNVYFYFFGLRLYKENVKKRRNVASKAVVQTPKVRPQKQGAKSSKKYNNTLNSGKKGVKKEPPPPPIITSTWSVVCHNFEDWEALIKKFKMSKYDKELGCILEKKYLPIISDLIVKREQLERKKHIEFIPRRTSSRIEKVKQQRENEQAAAEEAKLQKLEEERQKRAFEEGNKKKMEIVERAKRVEERHLAIEERANRAKLRELRNYYSDSSDFEEDSGLSTPSRSRSPLFQNNYYEEGGEDDHSQGSDVNSDGSQDSDVENEVGSNSSQGSNENSDNDGSADNDASSEEDNVDSGDNEKSSLESEDSEDENDENSSDQTSSLEENKVCDTNVNLGIRTMVYSRNKDCVQYQNVQPYASRNFQQVNGACVEQPHTARKTAKTYSRLDQQLLRIKNNANSVHPEIPVPKIITFNFRSSVPQNSTLTHPPVRFHSSTS